MCRVEAHVDVENANQAADEEAGADEQHARERDFGDDQGVSHPGAPAAFSRAARGVLQGVRDRGAARLQRRHETENDAGHERDRQREAERRGVGADVTKQRDTDRVQPGERAGARERQHQAHQRAAAREHDALGQHLREQPAAPGPEGGANGDLFLPRRRAREEQVRQVGADDEHHHRHRARQYPDGQAHAAADVIGERLDVALEAVPFLVFRSYLPGERSNLRLRAVRRRCPA